MRIRMSSSDTIFVLSYSIIMLNTDLHNPGVKNKMTIAEYVRNNRGIDTGKDLPEVFLRDIFEAIRDEEIRLHGEAPMNGEAVMDDFFWEGILRRSESIDEFSIAARLLSETPPGTSERDMVQVVMDCSPLPLLSNCFESVDDVAVASQSVLGLQDLARITAYYGQPETVNSLVRTMCFYVIKASAGGHLAVRTQIALRAAEQSVTQHAALFHEAEWRAVLDVVLQLWALDLLPQHLSEFDDFAGADGTPLESMCHLRPPYPIPTAKGRQDHGEEAYSSRGRTESSDGFLTSLARWFDDETRSDEEDEEEDQLGTDALLNDLLLGGKIALREPGRPSSNSGSPGSAEDGRVVLPVLASDPGEVHQQVKHFVSRCGFVEQFTSTGISKLPAESLQSLAKTLVTLSRPRQWVASSAAEPEAPKAMWPDWHDVADPVFCLELVTNMTCMPLGQGQSVSQIWPLVSTHFEQMLQFVIAGGGGSETQFIERVIVNTLRLCIRLIDNAELVPTLLNLTQLLSQLPPPLFTAYSERIACGLLVLVKETNLPHSGLRGIFSLLQRISESPGGTGACNAGIECLNYWLSDDQELSRLLGLQQFPELLNTLKAFAMQNVTTASTTALGHLSSLVPQIARGARSLPQAQALWQSLWVPTLHALADIAKEGSQRASAQAFLYLQRLLLEVGTELSVPWEQLPFPLWKECLEQVLFPLLRPPTTVAWLPPGDLVSEVVATRQANAAQLICRVLLTHASDWLQSSMDGFPVLFLRLLHIMVSEAAGTGPASERLTESLKNLLLVISVDPIFNELGSPKHGGTLLEAAWSVVSPTFPGLRQEVALILDPAAAEAGAVENVTQDQAALSQ